MKPLLLNLACLFVFCNSFFAQNFNRPVPPEFPPYEFQSNDDDLSGYFLLTQFFLSSTPPPEQDPTVALLDGNGYLLWYLKRSGLNYADFKFNHNTGQYSFYSFNTFNDNPFYILNDEFEFIDTLEYTGPGFTDSHDLYFENDGSYWLSGYRDTVMDLSAFTFNGFQGSPTTTIRGPDIHYYSPDGNLLWQWNGNNHIHPSEAYDEFGYNGFGTFDYAHLNSIDKDSDGHLIISFRNISSIFKINVDNGDIIWRLGGKLNSFTFQDNDYFSGQHYARRLPSGNISLFDNGNLAIPQRSRAVEYALDTINWIATKVDEYSLDPPVYARAMGSYQKRDDNLRVVNYGFVYRPTPSALLIDEADNTIAEITYTDSMMSYRVIYQDLPFIPERPEITCEQNDQSVTLTGPAGYTDYQWSNGETTSSIDISQPGTYMLWVNQGEGMLGSLPFVIDDVGNTCQVTSINTLNADSEKTLNRIYDLLGREVKETLPGQIYIYYFEDGSSELRSVIQQ